MIQSVRETLTALAEHAGVPLIDLDDDQLDLIAQRVITECGPEPTFTCIGEIVDAVRWSLKVVP